MINIQIQGIEDLMAFASIIKGEEVDLAKLRQFQVDLTKSSSVLRQAVVNSQQGDVKDAKSVG